LATVMRIRDGWTSESADDNKAAWMGFLLPDQSVTLTGALHGPPPVYRSLVDVLYLARRTPTFHFVEFSDSPPKWPQ
jgi:hypothetical protein